MSEYISNHFRPSSQQKKAALSESMKSGKEICFMLAGLGLRDNWAMRPFLQACFPGAKASKTIGKKSLAQSF